MNFSQFKRLTIPEGNVKSISIDGVTVWSATSGGWSIDDYEVNENLIISSVAARFSSVYVGKNFTIIIKSETAFDNKNYSALVYDETTESLCELRRLVIGTNMASMQLQFPAKEPRGEHIVTFWILDPNGKVSANSKSLTLKVR